MFKDANNVYTKGGLLVVREGDWLFKYPLTEIFSVVHKHGNHWGSNSHRVEEGLGE